MQRIHRAIPKTNAFRQRGIHISDKKSGDYVYALLFAFLELPDDINERREGEREREGDKAVKAVFANSARRSVFISAWLSVA